jgi:hypothetical protein
MPVLTTDVHEGKHFFLHGYLREVLCEFCLVAPSLTIQARRTRRRLETFSLFLGYALLYEGNDRAIKPLTTMAPAR